MGQPILGIESLEDIDSLGLPVAEFCRIAAQHDNRLAQAVIAYVWHGPGEAYLTKPMLDVMADMQHRAPELAEAVEGAAIGLDAAGVAAGIGRERRTPKRLREIRDELLARRQKPERKPQPKPEPKPAKRRGMDKQQRGGRTLDPIIAVMRARPGTALTSGEIVGILQADVPAWKGVDHKTAKNRVSGCLAHNTSVFIHQGGHHGYLLADDVARKGPGEGKERADDDD